MFDWITLFLLFLLVGWWCFVQFRHILRRYSRRMAKLWQLVLTFGGAAPFGVKGAGFDSPSDLLLPRSLLGLNQFEFYSLPSPADGEALAVGFDFGGVPHPSVLRVRVLTLPRTCCFHVPSSV